MSGYVRSGRGGAMRRRSAGIGRVVCIGGAFGGLVSFFDFCFLRWNGVRACMDNLDEHDAGGVAEVACGIGIGIGI